MSDSSNDKNLTFFHKLFICGLFLILPFLVYEFYLSAKKHVGEKSLETFAYHWDASAESDKADLEVREFKTNEEAVKFVEANNPSPQGRSRWIVVNKEDAEKAKIRYKGLPASRCEDALEYSYAVFLKKEDAEKWFKTKTKDFYGKSPKEVCGLYSSSGKIRRVLDARKAAGQIRLD